MGYATSESQRATFGNWFPLTAMRILVIHLRSPCLVASAFSHWAIWPAHGYIVLPVGISQDWNSYTFSKLDVCFYLPLPGTLGTCSKNPSAGSPWNPLTGGIGGSESTRGLCCDYCPHGEHTCSQPSACKEKSMVLGSDKCFQGKNNSHAQLRLLGSAVYSGVWLFIIVLASHFCFKEMARVGCRVHQKSQILGWWRQENRLCWKPTWTK